MSFYSRSPYMPGFPTVYPFDSVGDGSGFVNANGDYSAVAQNMRRVIPAGQVFALKRITILIGDGAGTTVNGYGGNVAPLTNGLIFSGRINGVNFTSSAGPFRSNADYAARGTLVTVSRMVANDQYFIVQQDFMDFGDGPLYLYGDKGDFMQYRLNDNFTFLEQHRFTLFGVTLYR